MIFFRRQEVGMQGKKWKETELLLVSGGKLNRKRDNKWDMERESFVCFFIALYGVVISWEEVGEMVGLFFFVLCFTLDLFFHSLSPNQQLYFSAPASSLFLPLFCTHLSLSLPFLMEN